MWCTTAPQRVAIATVSSTEPVSSSTISSTKPITDRRQRSSRSASSRTIIERLSMVRRCSKGSVREVCVNASVPGPHPNLRCLTLHQAGQGQGLGEGHLPRAVGRRNGGLQHRLQALP